MTKPGNSAPEFDVVIFGAISQTKGIDLLAAALKRSTGRRLRVLVAGNILNRDREVCLQHLASLGAVCDLTRRDDWIDDRDVLPTLASGRIVLLAYPRHKGDSRVLLESAAAGVPVVAHSWGLLGHTVRAAGLGQTVDCKDPDELLRVLHEALSPTALDRSGPRESFVAAHHQSRFAELMLAPFVRPQSLLGDQDAA